MIRFIILLLISIPANASSGFDASEMGLMWGIPFIGLLLSLALFPIFSPKTWHNHNGKISLLWSLSTLIPLTFAFDVFSVTKAVLHTYLFEYIPFIILITTLYTITGGIRLDIKIKTSPLINTIILFLGSFLASIIGTTGAAMLLIRPILLINKWRINKTHLMIFFIFSICNIGGCLTAVGDPPLLLGYLKGVDFFWTSKHLILPFLTITIPLLGLFFIVDKYYFNKDSKTISPTKISGKTNITGKFNFLLLAIVITVILLSGAIKTGRGIEIMDMVIPLESCIRDLSMIVLAILSWLFSEKQNRIFNMFTWEPVLEVGKLFAAIFITAMPVLAILDLGNNGALSSVVNVVTNANGDPINNSYFWLTGLLSSFLDNAPTYLVFFHIAGGDATQLMSQVGTLSAISAGSVFMGAMTYIGNAPNFLVKSIAEINEIRMPSFFGYIAWSAGILIPLFILTSWLFY